MSQEKVMPKRGSWKSEDMEAALLIYEAESRKSLDCKLSLREIAQ